MVYVDRSHLRYRIVRVLRQGHPKTIMGEAAFDVLVNGALRQHIISFQKGMPWKDWKIDRVCEVGWLSFLLTIPANDERWQHLTTWAMEAAIINGHHHVAKWLHHNRSLR
eukprot:26880-Eustigmatos_ZCMA.PRE.1